MSHHAGCKIPSGQQVNWCLESHFLSSGVVVHDCVVQLGILIEMQHGLADW